MKTSCLAATVAMAGLLFAPAAPAQYAGPRNYFPKNNPVPGVTNPAVARAAAQPQAPGTSKASGAASQPRFQDLPLNAQFYFLSDTNHIYAWTKLTASTAKNTKNGVTAAVKGETPVRK